MTPQIHPHELAQRLAEGEPTYLLDVRQPWESQIASLPNSVLIPLDQLAARHAEIRPDDDALIVVYCHHGVRSLSAAAFLLKSGRSNVVSLHGGIDAWSFLVDPTVPRY